MSVLEDELEIALKNSGYGDVSVKVSTVGMSGGYGIESELTLLIRVTKKKAKQSPDESYKIVRRRKTDE